MIYLYPVIENNHLHIQDNYLQWKDRGIDWCEPYIIKMPQISYYHFAFTKGLKRFELKQKWWQTRFGHNFDYGWHVNGEGKISDPNHKIFYLLTCFDCLYYQLIQFFYRYFGTVN